MHIPDWTDQAAARAYLADAILGDFGDTSEARDFIEEAGGEMSYALRTFLLAALEDEEADKAGCEALPELSTEKKATFEASMARVLTMRDERAKRAPQPEIPLAVGALWAPGPADSAEFRPAPYAYLVLATPQEDEDVVQVAPVSSWPAFAGHDDFVLRNSPRHFAGYAAMHEEHPVPRSFLRKGIGFLEDDELEALLHWRYAAYGLEHDEELVAKFAGAVASVEFEAVRLYREYAEVCDAPYRQAALECLQGLESKDSDPSNDESNITSLSVFRDMKAASGFDMAALVGAFTGAAASSFGLLRKRPTIVLIADQPPAEFELFPSESNDFWVLELVDGDASMFEAAVLIDGDGNELATIQNGSACFTVKKQAGFYVRLTDGTKAVLRVGP